MKVLLGNVDCEAQCGQPEKRTYEMRIDDIPCAHRLLWLADADDVLILPAEIAGHMIEYAAGIIPVGNVRQVVAATEDEPICLLTERTLERPELIERIAVEVRSHGALVSYFPDAGATRLAERLGLSCVASSPQIVALNKKSEFRTLASQLGVPIAPGAVCQTTTELTAAITSLLDHSGEVIVKQDLAGGGEGNVVLSRNNPHGEHTGTSKCLPVADDNDVRSASRELFERLTGSGNERIVVEAYLRNERVVCAELDGSGELLTWGTMRMEPVFNGFEFPCAFDESEAFLGYSKILARNCRDYDGRLNIDAFVSAGYGLLFSEINVRLGGCTHIDVLVRRLIGADYLRTRVLHSRNKVKATGSFSNLVARLPRFKRDTNTGVIVLYEDLERSGTFEYLAMGRTRAEVLDLETGIQEALAVS
jgi:hypothetical protein